MTVRLAGVEVAVALTVRRLAGSRQGQRTAPAKRIPVWKCVVWGDGGGMAGDEAASLLSLARIHMSSLSALRIIPRLPDSWTAH